VEKKDEVFSEKLPARNARQVIYNFWKLDLKCDVAGLIQLAFNSPETVKLAMTGNKITQTKNEPPRTVQTSPLSIPSHLMRANAADVFAAVLQIAGSRKRLISKPQAS